MFAFMQSVHLVLFNVNIAPLNAALYLEFTYCQNKQVNFVGVFLPQRHPVIVLHVAVRSLLKVGGTMYLCRHTEFFSRG